jgi:predicted DCC family thiol-disulfide oxidoreductase YuxK
MGSSGDIGLNKQKDFAAVKARGTISGCGVRLDVIWPTALASVLTHATVDVAMDADQPAKSDKGSTLPDGRIILFDAECVLCSANAQFVLARDKKKAFYLASMQGEVGARLFRHHGFDPADPSTILVIDGATVRKDSDAVLSIYETLGMPWKLASICRLVPTFLRDPLYRLVARNRYRIFGKRDTCWVAPAHLRSRVL